MTQRITAAVTTYNQARWIGATLTSVFNQSVAPAEVVVVDDGSTDDTPSVLERFGDRIRLIRQPNRGVAAARNAAVLASSSAYVALLDGDDLWLPHKLQHCGQLLAAHGDVPLLAHDVERITPDGVVIDRGEIARQLANYRGEATAVLQCLEELIEGNFVWTTSQVVVRRSAYLDAGLSDPSFAVGSDYDLYLRLAARGPFLLDSEVLTQWRQHDESASGSGLERQLNWGVDAARVLRKARARRDMAAHHAAIDRRQDTIVRLVYSSETRCGRWATARALARIAWSCSNLHAALVAATLLVPSGIRQASATATGMSVSMPQSRRRNPRSSGNSV